MLRRAFAILAGSVAFACAAGWGAAAVGEFGATDITKLVLETPGVTRITARSIGGAPFVSVSGEKYGGYVRADKSVAGKTIDGDWLLAVPLDSGETGGVFTALVYRLAAGRPEYVAALDARSGGMTLAFLAGHLHVTAPVFRKRDKPCCPSYRQSDRILYNRDLDGLIVVTSERLDANKPGGGTTPSPGR